MELEDSKIKRMKIWIQIILMMKSMPSHLKIGRRRHRRIKEKMIT
jgi:hypothetical protein